MQPKVKLCSNNRQSAVSGIRLYATGFPFDLTGCGGGAIFWTNQRAWRSKPMQIWMSLDTQLKLLFKDERTVHIGTHLSDPNILFQEFWGLFPFLLPSLTRRPDRGVWGKLLKVGKL